MYECVSVFALNKQTDKSKNKKIKKLYYYNYSTALCEVLSTYVYYDLSHRTTILIDWLKCISCFLTPKRPPICAEIEMDRNLKNEKQKTNKTVLSSVK